MLFAAQSLEACTSNDKYSFNVNYHSKSTIVSVSSLTHHEGHKRAYIVKECQRFSERKAEENQTTNDCLTMLQNGRNLPLCQCQCFRSEKRLL